MGRSPEPAPGAADDDEFVVGRVAANLGLGGKAEKGKATVLNVPPGKYTLFALPGALTPAARWR